MGQKKQRIAQRRAKHAQQREVARRQARAERKAMEAERKAAHAASATQAPVAAQAPAPPYTVHSIRAIPFVRRLVRASDAYAHGDADDDRDDESWKPPREFEELPHLAYRELERDWGADDEPALWRRKMPGYTTRARVAALSDAELLAGLAARGLPLTREAVLAQIDSMPPEGSAWTMSRRHWLPMAGGALSPQDRHFIGLAATELWNRWRPEAPPLERRLDEYADALDRVLYGDYIGRIRGMLNFLRGLRERLSQPGATPGELGGEPLPVGFWQFWLFHCADALEPTDAARELLLEVIAEGDRWIELRRRDPKTSSEAIAEAIGDLACLCEKLGLDDEAERRYRASLAVDPEAGEYDLQLAELLERTATDQTRLSEARVLREAFARR